MKGFRLERCLLSVRAMENPGGEVELIYVDSASTDNSREVARALGARVLTVSPTRPTAALGRNAGWRAASAPVVLFLDGDTLLHPAFVRESLPEFRNESVVAVWGHRREIYPERFLVQSHSRPGLDLQAGPERILRRRRADAVVLRSSKPTATTRG